MKRMLALVLALCVVLLMGVAASAQAIVTRTSMNWNAFLASWTSGDFADGTFSRTEIEFRMDLDKETGELSYRVDISRMIPLGFDEEYGWFRWANENYSGPFPLSGLSVEKRQNTIVRFNAEDVVLTSTSWETGEPVETEFITDIDVEFVGAQEENGFTISRIHASDLFTLGKSTFLALTGTSRASFLGFTFDPEPLDEPGSYDVRNDHMFFVTEFSQNVSRN